MASSDLAILITARDQASGPLRAIGAQLANLGKAVALPGQALGGLVSGLGKIGLAGMGIQALTGAANGLGQALGVGLNSEMEQVRASINAFTKDGAATEDILQKIRTEANSTPFAFREMATATAALMPVAKSAKVGLMDLVKEAEILAASNPMEGLAGASFSLREAMTGDFTSIIERFNLSRTTINKLKDEGVPALEIVRRAMKEMGFDSDLIAGKAQTLEGRWSTFLDTIDTLKMKISEPIFDLLKEGLTSAQQMFDENAEAVGAFAQGVADNIKRTITIVKALWAAFTIDPGAIGIVKEQLTEMFGDEVVAGIENFLAGFMNVIPEIQRFGAEAMTTAGIVRDQLGAALEWVASTGWPGVQAGAAAAADAVTDAAAAVRGNAAALSVLVGILTAAATAFALVRGAALLSAAALAVQTVATTVATAAMAALNAMITLNPIGILIVALAGGTAALITFYNTSETFRSTVERAFNAVKLAAFSMLDGIMGVVDSILGAFEGLAAGMQSIGINIGGSLAAGMRSQVGVVRAGAQALVEAAESAANAAAQIESPSKVFAEIGRMISIGLALGIAEDKWKAVDSAKELVEAVTSAAKEKFNLATDATDAFKNAIRRMADEGRAGEETLGRLRDALDEYTNIAREASRESGILKDLKDDLSGVRIFRGPEDVELQQRANDLKREQLALEAQFRPQLLSRAALAKELSAAEVYLSEIRDSGRKKAIAAAQSNVGQLKSDLHSADEWLKTYRDQKDAINDKIDALRLEEDIRDANNKAADLVRQAEIAQHEILNRQMEVTNKILVDRIKIVGDVGEAIDTTYTISKELEEKTASIAENIADWSFDDVRKAFDVHMPEIEGARAGGGPVSAGRRYLVGERGPEFFTPGLSGMIMPNGGGGGGALTVVVNVAGSVTSEQDLVECVRRGLLQTARRNGYSALGGLA